MNFAKTQQAADIYNDSLIFCPEVPTRTRQELVNLAALCLQYIYANPDPVAVETRLVDMITARSLCVVNMTKETRDVMVADLRTLLEGLLLDAEKTNFTQVDTDSVSTIFVISSILLVTEY